jgi:hypothetical protein
MRPALRRRLLSWLALAALLATGGVALSAAAGPRQYYSSWAKYPKRNYYYRTYYYKPAPDYSGYKHQYVVYYPSKPKYQYLYNPYKKQYWGRCPAGYSGPAKYQLLAEADRKSNVNDIPESAFPKPGPMPPVPESGDGAAMEAPPDDLPPAEGPGE